MVKGNTSLLARAVENFEHWLLRRVLLRGSIGKASPQRQDLLLIKDTCGSHEGTNPQRGVFLVEDFTSSLSGKAILLASFFFPILLIK